MWTVKLTERKTGRNIDLIRYIEAIVWTLQWKMAGMILGRVKEQKSLIVEDT